MECIKCGAVVTQGFCSNCGQRVGVKRITFRDSLSDFWTQIVGFDGMFFRTLRDLTLRPGMVARDYIRGIRIKYFGPIGYFFFMITLLLLWLSVLNLDFAELIRSKQNEMAIEEGNPRVIAAATQWIADNIRWVLFLAIPFQAFAARTILFRKSELNFVEHTVPLFYTTGHLFWLSMMMFAYRKVTGELPSVYMTVLSPLYFGYMYSNFISYQSRVKAFVKGMSVYIIGQFLFVLTMVVIVIVVVILLGLITPETLNKFRPIPR